MTPFQSLRDYETFVYSLPQLKDISFEKDVVLGKNWREYDLHHDLTDKGIESFFSDWNAVLK